MKRIIAAFCALLLMALPLALVADDYQPPGARGALAAATGVTISPTGKFSAGQVWLGKDSTANYTWVLSATSCPDCDSEQIATGNAAALPVTYAGSPAYYSYTIGISSYSAGTLFYRVVSVSK